MAVAPAELGYHPSPNGHKDLASPSGMRSIFYEAIPIDPALILRFHPVFRGVGVPRGDGSPIIFVPGLMESDYFHMSTISGWAKRMGYRSERSGIGVNVGPWAGSLSRLKESVKRVVEETGQKATVAGVSLGGTFATALGLRHPELVDTIITMATVTKDNIRSVAHPLVGGAGTVLVDPNSEAEEMLEEISEAPLPEGVSMYSIYPSADGVFHKEDLGDPRSEESLEVPGKHSTFQWNPLVFEQVGRIQGLKVERLKQSRRAKILYFPASGVA